MKWMQIRYYVGRLPTETQKAEKAKWSQVIKDVIKLLRYKVEHFEAYQFKT